MDKTIKNKTKPGVPCDEISDDSVDEQRRRFLLTTTSILGGVGALCALTPFVASWMPSAKAQAEGAPVQVDLSNRVQYLHHQYIIHLLHQKAAVLSYDLKYKIGCTQFPAQ